MNCLPNRPASPTRCVALSLPLVLWVLLPACSEDPAGPVEDAAGAVDDDTTDSGTIAAPDSEADAAALDVSENPVCPGEPGCACKSAADCDVPKCIATPNGDVCAKKCVDSCPDGSTCKTGTGDGLSYCLPTWGLLCVPCETSAACAKSGVANSFCVDYAGAGGFCGAFCQKSADCPTNYVCKLVETVDSAKRKQCVRESVDADFGECSCTDHSISGALATTCWISTKDAAGNVTGRCKGQRLCAESGLTPCEQLTGAQQDCRDTQCDLKKDGAVCDDGEKCTKGDLCKAGECVSGTDLCECQTNADCVDKDGNPCTGTPYCDVLGETNVCKTNPASVVTCDPGEDTRVGPTLAIRKPKRAGSSTRPDLRAVRMAMSARGRTSATARARAPPESRNARARRPRTAPPARTATCATGRCIATR